MIYLLGPGVRIIGYYLSWSLNSWGESNNIKVSDVNMTLTAFPPLFGNNSAQNAPARAEEGSIVLYRQPRPRLGLSRHPLLKFIHSPGYCRMLAHFPQTWESRPNIYFAHSLPWESARGTCFHKSIVSNFSREIINYRKRWIPEKCNSGNFASRKYPLEAGNSLKISFSGNFGCWERGFQHPFTSVNFRRKRKRNFRWIKR